MNHLHMWGLALSLCYEFRDGKIYFFLRWYYPPLCLRLVWQKKLMAGINILKSLGYNCLFSGSKASSTERMGKMKAFQISRTKLRGVGTTCGGRVSDTGHKHFVYAKALSSKDHQRQGFTWAKSDIITQVSKGRYPKGTMCCYPRGRRNASFVKLRS